MSDLHARGGSAWREMRASMGRTSRVREMQVRRRSVASSVRRKLRSPALARVAIRDAFWAPRIEVNRTETVPIEFEQCRKTGRIDAWKLDWREGMQPKPHPFWDSDVAKWIEAAAYLVSPRTRTPSSRGESTGSSIGSRKPSSRMAT